MERRGPRRKGPFRVGGGQAGIVGIAGIVRIVGIVETIGYIGIRGKNSDHAHPKRAVAAQGPGTRGLPPPGTRGIPPPAHGGSPRARRDPGLYG